ncbi:MAG: methyltransferase domain-containing protein [Gammaproteobacteria bacterium]|nr:methyltransferase domain-containing protein [Gammaproteobacteria bacterium]
MKYINRSSSLKALLLACAALAVSVGVQAQQAEPEDVNAPYRDPNLDVEVWVDRFESEGREAYDFREQIVEGIGLRPGQSVADVGAGTGLFEPLLAARVGGSGKVYAVDIVPSFIEHIEEKAAERGLTQVEAVLGAEDSIRLPADSVDVVFVCDAYHHFEDYEAMLESIHTALRPGGKLVIVEFDRVEGESPEFVLEHIRASKEEFTDEIEANGFRLTDDATVDGMSETFVRHFEKR